MGAGSPSALVIRSLLSLDGVSRETPGEVALSPHNGVCFACFSGSMRTEDVTTGARPSPSWRFLCVPVRLCVCMRVHMCVRGSMCARTCVHVCTCLLVGLCARARVCPHVSYVSTVCVCTRVPCLPVCARVSGVCVWALSLPLLLSFQHQSSGCQALDHRVRGWWNLTSVRNSTSWATWRPQAERANGKVPQTT